MIITTTQSSQSKRRYHKLSIRYVCVSRLLCLVLAIWFGRDLQQKKGFRKTDGCLIRSRDDGHKSKTCHVRLIPAAPMCPQQLDCSIDPKCRPTKWFSGFQVPRRGTTGFWSRLLECAIWHFLATVHIDSRATRRRLRRKMIWIVSKFYLNDICFSTIICVCLCSCSWIPHEHEKSIIYLFIFHHFAQCVVI